MGYAKSLLDFSIECTECGEGCIDDNGFCDSCEVQYCEDADEYFGDDSFKIGAIKKPKLPQLPLKQIATNKVFLKPKDKNAKLNIIRGDFAEYLHRKKYEALGWNVAKIIVQNNRTSHKFNSDDVEQICRLHKQMKVFKKLKKLTDKNLAGYPDFLCIKRKAVLLMESKADIEQLKDSQKERFKELKKAGFKIVIETAKVEINLDYSDTITYVL